MNFYHRENVCKEWLIIHKVDNTRGYVKVKSLQGRLEIFSNGSFNSKIYFFSFEKCEFKGNGFTNHMDG